MHVSVKLLANYRKNLPAETIGNQIFMDIPEDTLPETILDMLSLPPIPESVVLINGKTIVPGEPIKEGDVICVFSAMAGGSSK